ncbi:MAG: ubiquinone/menaquinone biosynthesis methyltransferase [Dehalococcoidia bacterium]
MTGVLPPADEKARSVQRMFDRIAPDYDRVNRVMTGRRDQAWRVALVRRLRIGPGETVLDLACGTGDFAEIARKSGARVIALDFARGMLLQGAARHAEAMSFVQGDALHLPLASDSLDAVVSGFALRNFTALPPVFAELDRILKPGGRLGLLEVDQPRNPILRAGHGLYFNRVVPLIGGLLSDRAAYRYLPASASYLPPEAELLDMLRTAGFTKIRKRNHMMGAIQSIAAARA